MIPAMQRVMTAMQNVEDPAACFDTTNAGHYNNNQVQARHLF